jgi:hypothetical protein
MKTTRFLPLFAGALLLAGCISQHETVYRDEPRLKIEFENDTAGRVFYEALSKRPHKPDHERKTSVSIPVVFDYEERVVEGENKRFNDAVRKCDTNQDSRITEQEARIFAEIR